MFYNYDVILLTIVTVVSISIGTLWMGGASKTQPKNLSLHHFSQNKGFQGVRDA